MTTAQSWRKERGMATQKLVAQWYAEHLWPTAESAGSGRSGDDIIGGVPVGIEVKGRRGFSPLEAIKQLKKRARGLFGPGWAVMRMDGQGPQSVGDFLVIMTLADHTEYIRELEALRHRAAEFGNRVIITNSAIEDLRKLLEWSWGQQPDARMVEVMKRLEPLLVTRIDQEPASASR